MWIKNSPEASAHVQTKLTLKIQTFYCAYFWFVVVEQFSTAESVIFHSRFLSYRTRRALQRQKDATLTKSRRRKTNPFHTVERRPVIKSADRGAWPRKNVFYGDAYYPHHGPFNCIPRKFAVSHLCHMWMRQTASLAANSAVLQVVVAIAARASSHAPA